MTPAFLNFLKIQYTFGDTSQNPKVAFLFFPNSEQIQLWKGQRNKRKSEGKVTIIDDFCIFSGAFDYKLVNY